MEPTLKMIEQPFDTESGYFVLKFSGAFDKDGYSQISKSFEESLNKFVGMDTATVSTLVFDFTDIDYINSQGIGTLMEIHSKLSSTGKKLVVIGLKQNVEDVFQAIGMNELVQTYPSMEAFKENK